MTGLQGMYPTEWEQVPVWALLQPRKVLGRPDLTLLSVYREHGVVPKHSRDDNHNKVGRDLALYQVARRGDVVMNKMKAWQGSIAVSDYEGLVSPDYMVLGFQRKVIPRFYHHLLRARPLVAEYRARAYGVRPSQWRLMYGEFRTMPLPVPPLPTQSAIAAFLDRRTAAINTLIEKKERLIALLAEKRTALIHQAVTKGLDPSVPMKDSGVPWIGSIPAHWEVKRLRDLVPADRGIMYGIVLPGPHVPCGVPIVKAGNCTRGKLKLESMRRTSTDIERRYVRSRLRPGDLVFSIRGSYGSAEIVPVDLDGANLTQDAARIAPKPHIDSRWLWYLASSNVFAAYLEPRVVGATVRGVNIWDLQRTIVVEPPTAEQRAISEALDKSVGAIDGASTRIRTQIDRLGEYRQALITAAVTGQLEIPLEAA